jgi:Tfp pilus assembly protein PilF
MNAQAVKTWLRGERQLSRGDQPAGEKSLEDAVRLEPRLVLVAIRLGGLYELRDEHAKAIDLYRKTLAFAPNNPVLLNNLAFGLAEYQHDPNDALPLAERAYGLSKMPTIADTLAWVHHLLGQDQLALPLIQEAQATMKEAGDVQMHAAFIHAALGDKAKAVAELDAAVKLDPKLADRPDVKALREKLK